MNCPFAGHSFLSAISSSNYPKIASEIESLYKDRIKLQIDTNDRLLLELKESYPKEFVEWYKDQIIFMKCLIDDEEQWFDARNTWSTNVTDKYYSFAELYKYYVDNIENKIKL